MASTNGRPTSAAARTPTDAEVEAACDCHCSLLRGTHAAGQCAQVRMERQQ